MVRVDDIVDNTKKHVWRSEGMSNYIVSGYTPLLTTASTQCSGIIDGYLGDTQLGGEFLNDKEELLETSKGDRGKLIMEFVKKHGYIIPTDNMEKILPSWFMEKSQSILEQGFKSQMDYVWEIEDDVLFLETYFAITRGGRYTLGGGRAVEHFMESFMPFYHPDVYREYTAISYPPRKHRKLELKLLKKVFPDTEVIKRTRKPWYYSIPFAKYAYRLLKPLANRANIRLTPKIAQYYIGDWIAGETRLNTMIRDLLATNSILEQVFPGEEVNKKVMKELLSSGSRYSFYNTFIDFEIYVRQLFQNLGVDEIKILDTDGSAFATITKPEGKQNN